MKTIDFFSWTFFFARDSMHHAGYNTTIRVRCTWSVELMNHGPERKLPKKKTKREKEANPFVVLWCSASTAACTSKHSPLGLSVHKSDVWAAAGACQTCDGPSATDQHAVTRVTYNICRLCRLPHVAGQWSDTHDETKSYSLWTDYIQIKFLYYYIFLEWDFRN